MCVRAVLLSSAAYSDLLRAQNDATIAAVSERSMRAPSDTGRTDFSCIYPSSGALHPPSGPISTPAIFVGAEIGWADCVQHTTHSLSMGSWCIVAGV